MLYDAAVNAGSADHARGRNKPHTADQHRQHRGDSHHGLVRAVDCSQCARPAGPPPPRTPSSRRPCRRRTRRCTEAPRLCDGSASAGRTPKKCELPATPCRTPMQNEACACPRRRIHARPGLHVQVIVREPAVRVRRAAHARARVERPEPDADQRAADDALAPRRDRRRPAAARRAAARQSRRRRRHRTRDRFPTSIPRIQPRLRSSTASGATAAR